ncbi:MAG: STAS domain-containing protein [Isosphaerales bacterium]
MLKPSLETHNVDGILVAEFWECFRLDPAPVHDLRTQYESHRKGHGRPEVVVDLSGVGFAGSAALGIFVALQRLARQNGGKIVFCNVDPTVSEVFRASKLDSLFEFAADRPAALRAIKEGTTAEPRERKPAGDESARQDKPQIPGRSGMGPLRRRNRDPESA